MMVHLDLMVELIPIMTLIGWEIILQAVVQMDLVLAGEHIERIVIVRYEIVVKFAVLLMGTLEPVFFALQSPHLY